MLLNTHLTMKSRRIFNEAEMIGHPGRFARLKITANCTAAVPLKSGGVLEISRFISRLIRCKAAAITEQSKVGVPVPKSHSTSWNEE